MLFSKFLPRISLETRAKIFVITTTITTAFIIALTTYLLSKNKQLAFVSAILFMSHPLTKFYATFDTQITRMLLFTTLTLCAISLIVLAKQSKTKFAIALT